MRINKKLVLAAAVAGSTGLAAITATSFAATSPASQSTTTYPSIVDKIATKFNLNKDDVKKVFDEDRAAHQAEHQKALEDRLTQAVKDGKLTEAQKTELLSKLNTMHQDKQASRDTMKQQRDDLDAWAKQQNIDLSTILPGPGMGHGMRHMGMDGDNDQQ